MKKTLTKLMLGAVFLIGGGLTISNQAHAATGAENTEFEVIPLMPSSQVNISKNYYDLKIKPGETETIRMEVKNYASHKITVYSNLGNSFTQTNGNIAFKQTAPDNNSAVSPNFTSIANLSKKYQKIVLEPKAGKIVSATIKMPEGKQRGFINGDWHFTEYAKNKNSVKAAGAGASSNYSYSVGVVLRGTHYKVYPELKYAGVKPILSNGQPGLTVNLRNTQPMAITHATVKAKITKKGVFGSKHVNTVTDKSIAPNSIMRILIPWDFEQLKPGKYTVDVAVKGNNLWNKLPMTWKFKKNFTIKNQQVKKINADALKKPTNKWAYVATATGVLSIISMAVVIKIIKIG